MGDRYPERWHQWPPVRHQRGHLALGRFGVQPICIRQQPLSLRACAAETSTLVLPILQ